jgi:hypothetical protein
MNNINGVPVWKDQRDIRKNLWNEIRTGNARTGEFHEVALAAVLAGAMLPDRSLAMKGGVGHRIIARGSSQQGC